MGKYIKNNKMKLDKIKMIHKDKAKNIIKMVKKISSNIDNPNDKEQLFENSNYIYLQIQFNEPSKKGKMTPIKMSIFKFYFKNNLRNPHIINLKKLYGKNLINFFSPLRHPLYDDKSEIVVIAKESKIISEKLKNTNIFKSYNIRVISINDLKTEYYSYSNRRSLRDKTDLFLADKTIVDRLSKPLGSIFIKRNKMPMPVKLTNSNFEKNLKKALSSTPYFIKKSDITQIKENMKEVLKFFSDKLITKIRILSKNKSFLIF